MGNVKVQIIRLLSESLIFEIYGEHSQRMRESCAKFIIEEHKKMAYIFRVILALLAVYFNFEPVLKHKKFFIGLPIKERSEIIKQWQFSYLSFKRQFIKLHLNLALLSCYDNEESTENLGIERTTYLRSLSFYTGVEDD